MKLLPIEHKQQTIIIVEDDYGNATILEMLLSMGTSHIPFHYRSAVDLLQNIDEVKRIRPALFLVDYLLPTLNGLSLCRYLHETGEFSSIPVVLVSGSTDASLVKEAEQIGITLLHKPYDIDALLAVVRQYV